jgi:phenylalanyl-tRNA synthetase alpha chain
LVIDKNINITHLKGTIDFFTKKFFGEKAVSRIRPFHFQFTEPSFEVDFSCVHCNGRGCKFCKSGWHEVGGAGMVHPNVLKAGEIDPKKYSGFAFGWGVERVFLLKPDLNIDDIRTLYSSDLKILKQY